MAIKMIKKVCNREIDENDEKVVDTSEEWNKIDEKIRETKRK